MEGVESRSSQDPKSLTKTSGGKKCATVVQVLLRSVVILCTLIAAYLMFTSKETTIVYGLSFDASYSYEPASVFFAYANVIASVLSLVSLGTVCFLHHQWTFFLLCLHDLVMLVLLMAACAASTAVGNIGSNGNTHTSWMPICDHFAKFCKRVATSVTVSYLAVIILFALTVLSVLRMQTRPI